MTQEELDRSRQTSIEIIRLAEELISKLETNNQVILERKMAVSANEKLTNDLIAELKESLTSSANCSVDPAAKFEHLVGSITSIIVALESNSKSSLEDIVRLEATQDGMRRALEAVKSTGKLRIQELEKFEAMVKSTLIDGLESSSI